MISVVVPTLNEAKYLENTLQCLLNQRCSKPYELIVADGGSTDATLRIAERYADRVVIAQRKGVAAERNAGARVAKGKVLVFVDADTLLLPHSLERLMAPFRQKGVVGVACPILPLSNKLADLLSFFALNCFVKLSILFEVPQVCGTCCSYSKEAFERVGGFNEGLNHLEDFDFSLRISKLGKIAWLDEALALTSTRRFERWGRFRTIGFAACSYLSYMLSGKPLHGYAPVR